MNKFWIPFILILAIIGFFFWVNYREYQLGEVVAPEVTQKEKETEKQVEEKIAIEADSVPTEKKDAVIENTMVYHPLEMAFMVQAPDASWSDERFQNACEEASLLMVSSFLADKKIEDARKEMLAIMAFEEKKFGHAYDTSAVDTNTVLQEYFGVTSSRVEELRSLVDMRDLVTKKNLLILPTDGRKLHNPYFTAPGPETHMLVVLGYDTKNKVFIVHDPGTKRGALYRYSEEVLFGAIADYASGTKHQERKSIQKKVIVVSTP